MNFFNRSPPDSATLESARRDEAYREGVDDARTGLAERDSAVRNAYDRGRRDERARRVKRGHPVLSTLLLLVAAAGAFVIYLGVQQGSFSSGGETIDQHIQTAQQAGRNTADRAGDALQAAGQHLKRTAGNG